MTKSCAELVEILLDPLLSFLKVLKKNMWNMKIMSESLCNNQSWSNLSTEVQQEIKKTIVLLHSKMPP